MLFRLMPLGQTCACVHASINTETALGAVHVPAHVVNMPASLSCDHSHIASQLSLSICVFYGHRSNLEWVWEATLMCRQQFCVLT